MKIISDSRTNRQTNLWKTWTFLYYACSMGICITKTAVWSRLFNRRTH